MLYMKLHQLFAMHRKYFSMLRLKTMLGLLLLMNFNSSFAATCDMRLSEAKLDYGKLYRGMLDTNLHSKLIPLGNRQLMLTVICQAPTTIGIRFDAPPADSESFRFANKGKFKLAVSNAQVDGTSVFLAPRQATVSVGSISQLLPNTAVVAMSHGKHAIGKLFTANIEINTYIDVETTHIRDEMLLEGKGTFILLTNDL